MFSNLPTAVALSLLGWAALALGMLALWLLQRRIHDAGIVDVAWAAGMGLMGVAHACFLEGDVARRLLVGVLAGVWSSRLALHLLKDRVLGKPEDGRYQALRRSWGEQAQPRFFMFFQAQALAAVLLAAPFAVAASSPRPLGLLDGVGLLTWMVAVVGESVADAQLAAFRGNPAHRGQTCRDGMWAWSRHPNYFFEWLHWWAVVALAVGAPWWGFALLGPIVMLLLLLRVTGIPYTERRALETRGDDYRRYQREVSAFIPWPPRAAQESRA